MEVVCAWCGKKLGEKPPYEDKGVTHGMCQDCYDKEMARAKRKRKWKRLRQEVEMFWNRLMFWEKKQPAAPPTGPAGTKTPEPTAEKR